MTTHPLILVANDDGIDSPGLVALVEAVRPLGTVFVAAPTIPFSSAGRGFCWGTRQVERRTWAPSDVTAYAVDAPPAFVVRLALDVLVPRLPDLMVSGINHGENMGSNVTVSGTVGAALEAAVSGIPALAFSLEAPVEYHDNPKPGLDFAIAATIARRLARQVLRQGLPRHVDLVKVDVPADATDATPWAITRVSRQQYWRSIIGTMPDGTPGILGYERAIDYATLEPDSDIHALAVRREVSISPLTVDLSAAAAPSELQTLLAASQEHGSE